MKGKGRSASAKPHYKSRELRSFGADKLSHALLHTSSSIIVGLDSGANIVLFNRGAEDATGWKAKDAIGKNWVENFIPKSERKIIYNAFESTVMRDGAMSAFENRVLTKVGKHLHVRWHNTVITTGSGFLMTLSVGDDVTNLRHMERKLLLRNKKLRELSEMQERFLADITHELKTPLSVIMLNLELVMRTSPARKPGLKAPLEMMWRNSMRLSRSIEQVMQLTKLGSVDIKPVLFPLAPMMGWVVEDYRPLANSKNIKLSMSGRDIRVKGDAHILAMAVSNLVSNAVKFTEKGSVDVSWKENNGDVLISVTDTGIGIRPKSRPKIFTKFFKENHNAPGSGIGLAISYALVEKMGGSMAFRSEQGKGSTFTIKVPKEVKK